MIEDLAPDSEVDPKVSEIDDSILDINLDNHHQAYLVLLDMYLYLVSWNSPDCPLYNWLQSQAEIKP